MTRSRVYAWYVVALLGALYFMSWVDRLVLSLLVEPLKQDLGIDDVQVSYLFGASFAVFYSAFGVLLARVADLGNRRRLIVLGVMVWCAMTIASGFVETFTLLLLFRVGLAFGEAALSPAALSIISDLFPQERRALPLSIYSVFGQVGGTYGLSVAAFVVGLLEVADLGAAPMLAQMSSWQLVLVVVGCPGVLLGLLFLATVREPPRSEAAPQPTSSSGQTVSPALWSYLRSHGRFYASFLIGLAAPGVILFAITGWMPTLLVRDFGWTAAEAGIRLGTPMAIFGVAGILVIPNLAQALARRGWRTAVPDIALISVAAEAIALVVALRMQDPWLLIAVLMVSVFFVCGSGVLPAVAINTLAPNRVRATLVAFSFAALSLIGMGVGPTLIAWLANDIYGGPDQLAPAISTAAMLCAPIAMALLWLSRTPYRRKATEFASQGEPLPAGARA